MTYTRILLLQVHIYRLAIENCAETVDLHGDVNKLYQVPNETHDSKANGDCLRNLHEL